VQPCCGATEVELLGDCGVVAEQPKVGKKLVGTDNDRVSMAVLTALGLCYGSSIESASLWVGGRF